MPFDLASIGPEITLAIGACVCLAAAAAGPRGAKAVPVLAGIALIVAALIDAVAVPPASRSALGGMSAFVNPLVCGMGLLLVMLLTQTRQVSQHFSTEEAAMPAESFSLLLFSLVGLMLCASADDLVWLFLALELTSLPTYVIVATSRSRPQAQEAGVKYFFLGAMAAALFLYGFAMLYGATGSTAFPEIRQVIAAQIANDEVSLLVICGLALSLLGICFKIAAVPMHAYVADVYQGAAAPVSAMLAFVPKTAGFAALFGLVALVGGPLPDTLHGLLWLVAVLTMTVGNVLGLMQHDVKRVLAYSSVAHSGYLLVGLIAATSDPSGDAAIRNGLAAILFYLVGYGLATIITFGVLGTLRTADGDEVTTYDGIAGLARTHPHLAALMLIGTMSLLGFPLTAGFLGKIYLLGSAMAASERWLVVIAVINSAIGAVYYLRIVGTCYFGDGDASERRSVSCAPATLAMTFGAVATLILFFGGQPIIRAADQAAPKELLRQPIAVQEAETKHTEARGPSGQ